MTNALLGTLDPTLRPNGIYKLRIVGNDGVQTGGIEYEVSIAGELKLGNFTLDFVDLVIPLAGLPIVATRPDSPHAKIYRDIAARVRVGLDKKQNGRAAPKIVIES